MRKRTAPLLCSPLLALLVHAPAFAQTGVLDRLVETPDQQAADAPAKTPTASGPYDGADQAAFRALDKNDIDALKAFRTLFPNSPLIGVVEALIAAMGGTPAPETKTPQVPDANTAAQKTTDPEPTCDQAWQAVASTCVPAALNGYLTQCPDSAATGQAERRLVALDIGLLPECRATAPVQAKDDPKPDLLPDQPGPADPPTAAQIEAQLALSRRARADVQRFLNALGYGAGPADADFGQRTRRAIRRFEAANGYPETGFLDANRHARLKKLGAPAWKKEQARLKAEQAEKERRAAGDAKRAQQEKPRPAPQIADPRARNFIVYMGFDRTSLTARARATLDTVAAQIKSQGCSALSIVGHADTAEPNGQGLSERRARRVAGALVERGIPAGWITLAGRGPVDQARPTGDNVREPLNRRAEISLFC